jgi:hypothetical protein
MSQSLVIRNQKRHRAETNLETALHGLNQLNQAQPRNEDPIRTSGNVSNSEAEMKRIHENLIEHNLDILSEAGKASAKLLIFSDLDRIRNNRKLTNEVRYQARVYRFAPLIIHEDISNLPFDQQHILNTLKTTRNLHGTLTGLRECETSKDDIQNEINALVARMNINNTRLAYLNQLKTRLLYNYHGNIVMQCCDEHYEHNMNNQQMGLHNLDNNGELMIDNDNADYAEL